MKSNIKDIIDAQGLRQKYVAEKMGVTPQQLNNWIKGKSYPPMNKAFKLAKILNCTVHDLWELEE